MPSSLIATQQRSTDLDSPLSEPNGLLPAPIILDFVVVSRAGVPPELHEKHEFLRDQQRVWNDAMELLTDNNRLDVPITISHVLDRMIAFLKPRDPMSDTKIPVSPRKRSLSIFHRSQSGVSCTVVSIGAPSVDQDRPGFFAVAAALTKQIFLRKNFSRFIQIQVKSFSRRFSENFPLSSLQIPTGRRHHNFPNIQKIPMKAFLRL